MKKVRARKNKSATESSSRPTEAGPAVIRVFENAAARDHWSYVCSKQFIAERVLEPDHAEEFSLTRLLVEENLWGSVTRISRYAEKVVREFYCNMPKDVDQPSSPNYQRVYIRGKYYSLTPSLLADAMYCWNPEESCPEDYDVIAAELTGGRRHTWNASSSALKPSELTARYSALHKLAIHNWMPCKHTTTVSQKLGLLLFKVGTRIAFDLGALAYERIIFFAGQQEKFGNFVFPAAIFTLLVQQGLVVAEDEEFTQPGSFRLSAKLAQGARVVDITEEDPAAPADPADAAAPLSPDAMIIVRDTIKFLRREEYQLKKQRRILEARLAQSLN